MGRRNRFAESVQAVFEDSDLGWTRCWSLLATMGAWFGAMFPGLPMVRDGETKVGRGVTAFDIFREIVRDGVVFNHAVSLKTRGAEHRGHVPLVWHMCTGNPSTIKALVDGCRDGAPYQTLFVVKDYKKSDGSCRWACVDLGPLLAHHGVAPLSDYPEGGYEKAPPFYVKWSAKRPSGVKRAARLRAMGLLDETVRIIQTPEGPVMHGPDWIRYPILCVSLYALGASKADFHTGNVADLPALLETEAGFGGEWA